LKQTKAKTLILLNIKFFRKVLQKNYTWQSLLIKMDLALKGLICKDIVTCTLWLAIN
jgi:hypothetical protein